MKTALTDTIINFRFGGIEQGIEHRPVNAQGGDETCEVVSNPDGTYSIKTPNGEQYLSIQEDGSLGWRPTSDPSQPGGWEKFSLIGNVLTELSKDGVSRAPIQFIGRDL